MPRRKFFNLTISKHIVDCSITVTVKNVLCYTFIVHSNMKETPWIIQITSEIVHSKWFAIKTNVSFLGDRNVTFSLEGQCMCLTMSLIMCINIHVQKDSVMPKIKHRCF